MLQVGLDVIRRKGTVLQCHKDMAEMVSLSEIGMSKAILEAGYNLDSLMLRYQVGLCRHLRTLHISATAAACTEDAIH